MELTNNEDIFEIGNFPDHRNQQSNIFSFHKEVEMVRKLIRESRLLCERKEECQFLLLDGTLPYSKLINMYFKASNNYEIYLKNIEKYIDFEFDSIYVTVEDETEFSNGNNWTVPMIKKEIESLLYVIGNENSKLELKSLYLN